MSKFIYLIIVYFGVPHIAPYIYDYYDNIDDATSKCRELDNLPVDEEQPAYQTVHYLELSN